MSETRQGKFIYFINLLYFKIGELVFPAMSVFLNLLDNRNSEIKKYFDQALKSFESNQSAISLLNLNMVLSLKQDHFMALVLRGRIYIKEKRYRLASEDFLQANRSSRYRFVHYDLYREYYNSVNQETGNFELPHLYSFNYFPGTMLSGGEQRGQEVDKGAKLPDKPPGIWSGMEEENLALTDEPDFETSEKSKFSQLGPITQKEIEDTDWDQLIKKLTS